MAGLLMPTLFVNEIFFSLQGEGSFTGVPAFFLRLQGCNLSCPFCDTKYALHRAAEHRLPLNSVALFDPNKPKEAFAPVEVPWLLDELAIKKSSYKPCVILTGGEPCDQDITELIRSLRKENYSVHIETNGTRPIPDVEDLWITLSPKAKGVLEENWSKASEIKLPVGDETDIKRYAARLSNIAPEKVLLQPIDTDKQATELCVRYCLKMNWRLSLQMHKYIGIR